MCIAFRRRTTSVVALAFITGISFTVMSGIAEAAAFDGPLYTAPKTKIEPFGIGGAMLRHGGLQRKWHSITRALRIERSVLAQCRVNQDSCPIAAKRFLAMIDKAAAREGIVRIAEINRTINLDIRPMSDLAQYGVKDLWTSPLMTFATGAGDCEDYAIAKYLALREIGFNEDDLRLAVVHDDDAQEDHAVAAVRYEGHWLILDNRTLAIRTDSEIAEFKPLFVLNNRGVQRLVAPPLVQPPQQEPLPAVTQAASGPELPANSSTDSLPFRL